MTVSRRLSSDESVPRRVEARLDGLRGRGKNTGGGGGHALLHFRTVRLVSKEPARGRALLIPPHAVTSVSATQPTHGRVNDRAAAVNAAVGEICWEPGVLLGRAGCADGPAVLVWAAQQDGHCPDEGGVVEPGEEVGKSDDG
jgi:hypothetical protein